MEKTVKTGQMNYRSEKSRNGLFILTQKRENMCKNSFGFGA